MYYYLNPAHKTETTEAGPPRWRPDKEPCPRMTPRERTTLLQESVEYHGYPTCQVPGSVLRRFRDQGRITNSEYRSRLKRLG